MLTSDPSQSVNLTGLRLTMSTALTLASRWLISAAVAVAWLSSWKDVVTTAPLMATAAVSVLRGIPDEQRLLTKIQRNYDSRVRPVYNSTHRVTVNFALTLVQIIDVVSIYLIMIIIITITTTIIGPYQ